MQRKSALKYLKEGFVENILDIFSNHSSEKFGAMYVIEYLCTHYRDQFFSVCNMLGYIITSRMDAATTAAMWSHSRIHQVSKQRTLASHIKSHCGSSLFATETSVKDLVDKNEFSDRIYGNTEFTKIEIIAGKEKRTEKKVQYYVECPFQNVLLELKKRFLDGKDCEGYTLGKYGCKFIVINDGGDHGNVAFRQAITVLSTNTGTSGNVIITARIEEHEGYPLFDSTIMPILSAGITRLQATAFIFIRTSSDSSDVIPVPYKATLQAPHPFLEGMNIYDTTSSHPEFVVDVNDTAENNKVVLGSLQMVVSAGYVSSFLWCFPTVSRFCLNFYFLFSLNNCISNTFFLKNPCSFRSMSVHSRNNLRMSVHHDHFSFTIFMFYGVSLIAELT